MPIDPCISCSLAEIPPFLFHSPATRDNPAEPVVSTEDGNVPASMSITDIASFLAIIQFSVSRAVRAVSTPDIFVEYRRECFVSFSSTKL